MIGDTTHGDGKHNRFFREHFGCQRLLLHAASLQLTHPYTHEPLTLNAPLPDDFSEVVRLLLPFQQAPINSDHHPEAYMERHSPLTLAQILTRLARVLGHKQTGTFYIATDNNTSCRFAVESGKLTHCTHRRDQGNAAIHSLLETSGGSCSFSENQSIAFPCRCGY